MGVWGLIVNFILLYVYVLLLNIFMNFFIWVFGFVFSDLSVNIIFWISIGIINNNINLDWKDFDIFVIIGKKLSIKC